MKKKMFIILSLAVICGTIASLIGFPKASNQLQSKETSGTYSYTKSFPWDLTLWGNAKLKCTNNGTETSEILVSLLGKKDSESLATSFNISAGKTITKNISKLASLRKKQKSQSGVILVESENRDIDCQIIKLPFKGSSSIDSSDILMGESYILSTPNVLNNTDKDITGRIVIYNLSDSSLNIDIVSFNQAGILDYHKQLKTINAGKKRVLKLKNAIKKNLTFHIIPKEEYSRYFAYLELTDQNGKKHSIKSSYNTKESLINNAKGTLVVSNISSVPTSFAYAISSNGKKAYQGNEWLMPYSHRIINLKKYSKNLSSPKMRIKAGNLFKDKRCVYNKLLNDKVCSYTTREGLIALTFYSKSTRSPEIIKNARYDELAGIPSYDIDDYLTKEIPVKCYKNKDTDQDGVCDFEEEVYGSNPNDKDSDNDGLDDGIELFHNFSSPNKIDTDDDDYDDYTEYEARTLSVFPLIYPNSPSLYTIEGMKLLASYSENLKNNDKNRVVSNESNEIKTSRATGDTILKNILNSDNKFDKIVTEPIQTPEWPKNTNLDPFFHFSEQLRQVNEYITVTEKVLGEEIEALQEFLNKKDYDEFNANVQKIIELYKSKYEKELQFKPNDEIKDVEQEIDETVKKAKWVLEKNRPLFETLCRLAIELMPAKIGLEKNIHNLEQRLDYCSGENICIVNSNGLNDTKLNEIKRIISNCLNQIRKAIVNTNEESSCNYCRTTFEIKNFGDQCSENSLRYYIENIGNSSYGITSGNITIDEGNKTKGLEYTLCHELSHAFGLVDIYNQIHKKEYPCTIMSQPLCAPTHPDELNFQIVSAAYQAKVDIATILRHLQRCETESGKAGLHVVFKNENVDFVGKCIEFTEETNCKERYTDFTSKECPRTENIPCGECNEEKPYLKINPQNQDQHICCADSNAVYCENKKQSEDKNNDHCCSKACIKDECCDNPIEYEGEQICCDKKENSNEYMDDRCLKCKEDEIMCDNECCAGRCIINGNDKLCCPEENFCNGQCCTEGQICDRHIIGQEHCEENPCKNKDGEIEGTPYYKRGTQMNSTVSQREEISMLACCKSGNVSKSFVKNSLLLSYRYQVCCDKEEEIGKLEEEYICCDKKDILTIDETKYCCNLDSNFEKVCAERCEEVGTLYNAPLYKCCKGDGIVLDVVNFPFNNLPFEDLPRQVCCNPDEISDTNGDKFGCSACHKFKGILFHNSNNPSDSSLACCAGYENFFHKDTKKESPDGYPYGKCCGADEIFLNNSCEKNPCNNTPNGLLYISDKHVLKCCEDYKNNFYITDPNKIAEYYQGVCCKQGEIFDYRSKTCVCEGKLYTNFNYKQLCCESNTVCEYNDYNGKTVGNCCKENETCDDNGECIQATPTISGTPTLTPLPTDSIDNSQTGSPSESETSTDSSSNTPSGSETEANTFVTEESPDETPSDSESLTDGNSDTPKTIESLNNWATN